jgi:uncharacterized protein YjeT (DUF2065 family)
VLEEKAREVTFNMRSSLAMLVGFAIAAFGIVGLISPHTYARLGSLWEASPGLYIAAAIQLVIGLVLIRAAPASRSPFALGALGVIALIEAVMMPLLGHGRAHAIAHWWESQSESFLRMWGLLELAIGVLIVCAVAPSRRALRAAPST